MLVVSKYDIKTTVFQRRFNLLFFWRRFNVHTTLFSRHVSIVIGRE